MILRISCVIVHIVIIVAVFTLLITSGLSATLQRQELSISECAVKVGECDETKGRPVCGTDDQTYPTRCHLLRVQCSGHQVSIRYRGSCKACNEARDYALKHRTKTPPKFIPRCKSDGTYALIQCLADTGCWCSDKEGKPIENTSVRNGKPKCHDYSKANIRRSPPHTTGTRRSTKRICSQTDRALFNGNLFKIFQSEYIRVCQQNEKGGLGKLMKPFAMRHDNEVTDWKFANLDANANEILDKNEYRELKKLVKRAVKPRRCGRAFGKFCDLDNDARLSRLEWNSCLSKDNNNHADFEDNSETNFDEDDDSSQQLYDDEADYEDDEDETDHLGYINAFGSSTKFPSIHFLIPKSPDSPLKETENESDCLADQTTALEEQRHGNTLIYVPECTSDGRYQRVQCYRSTPYCWCVNEETGKNIPGTSVKDRRPQCDAVYTITRPMKGCPEPRKTTFIIELKEYLKNHIISGMKTGNININNTSIGIWNNEDERIASQSFLVLDKNKNKAWERKEWKIFRELVTNTKTLRKCGKKMPRYCDVNSDKKITLNEWLACLRSQSSDTLQHTSVDESDSSKPLKLTGSNPLEQYLKE
ncbi:SPARC-related modular calcium-binding protein 2 isoform X2 [Glossina fuscipes]|uniref:SPARC-related modular calcium-binding protein 2 isoform X2 n=1 Tax=Glossina fuscipes TaxID=7396 RepID=A0A9C6DLA9_9MUSC|nr:SPARC-related modular calcium-binding protein 2 isoform X2 [Glossina fuscipes]